MTTFWRRKIAGISALFASICACGGASVAHRAGSTTTAGAAGNASPAGSAGSAGAPNSAGSAGAPNGGVRGGEGDSPSTGGGGSSGTSTSAGGAPEPPRMPVVYVGSTNGQISLYKLGGAPGQLTFLKAVAAGNNPSFLAFDAARAHAYAVNEVDAMLVSFSIDRQSGDLTLLNRVASGGASPAFVGVDRSGAYVMVANYGTGTTRVLSILEDGALGAARDDRAPGVRSHMIITDPANKFAFVMNLGSDTIAQYEFDASTGTLRPNSVPTVNTVRGAGPRHLAFHPNGKHAYVINELDHTLSAYKYDAARGQLSVLQTLSTVPLGTTLVTTGAEVVVAPSGNFVYGSNRGHDSIARFAVDGATGMLTLLGTTPSGGNVPRSFALSADGALMLVANESGTITSFSVDPKSGELSKVASLDVPPRPQFIAIVDPLASTPPL